MVQFDIPKYSIFQVSGISQSLDIAHRPIHLLNLFCLISFLGLKVLSFVAMDAQYGVALTVNGRASYTVAIGPNIALDLQISPSRGAVLINNYMAEAQQRTRVASLNAMKNGVNKMTLLNKAAKIAMVAPVTANAINQVNTLDNVYNTLKKKKKRKRSHINRRRKCKYINQLFS